MITSGIKVINWIYKEYVKFLLFLNVSGTIMFGQFWMVVWHLVLLKNLHFIDHIYARMPWNIKNILYSTDYLTMKCFYIFLGFEWEFIV